MSVISLYSDSVSDNDSDRVSEWDMDDYVSDDEHGSGSGSTTTTTTNTNLDEAFISFGHGHGSTGDDFTGHGHANSNSHTNSHTNNNANSNSHLDLIIDLPAPWLTNYTFENSKDSIQNLHCECLEFCRFISLTDNEMATRSKVIKEIQSVIHGVFPNTTVQFFGSQLSKTLTPSSDLDLVIMNIDVKDPLRVLAEHIRKADIVSYLEVISSAKVPIVKFDHRDSGTSVDIVINNDDGLLTGKLIQKLSREFPPLRPLVVILKTFLSQRKLNDTYTGGIGSFVLSVMIVSFLQQRQKILAFQQISSATWNLGSLLVEFFHLYGVKFNYEEVGISIRDGGSYFQKRSRRGDWWNPQRPNLLALENPTYPDIDMGRSSFNMYRIKRSFDHAYQVLIRALCQKSVPSLLSFIIRSDDPMLVNRKRTTSLSPRTMPTLTDVLPSSDVVVAVESSHSDSIGTKKVDSSEYHDKDLKTRDVSSKKKSKSKKAKSTSKKMTDKVEAISEVSTAVSKKRRREQRDAEMQDDNSAGNGKGAKTSSKPKARKKNKKSSS